MNDWILTYTGKHFYPLRPHPEDICLDDIAHALSNICRFTGHSSVFYSVAQHCVHVSEQLPSSLAAYGLLHDASEAYIADVSHPLKHTPEFQAYREAEARLQRAIYRRFGLLLEPPQEVHEADQALLEEERCYLMGDEWEALQRMARRELMFPWGPERADWEFRRKARRCGLQS